MGGVGEALINLHIGYETVAPFALTRADVTDAKAHAAGLAHPRRCYARTLALAPSETTLTGVPPSTPTALPTTKKKSSTC